MMADPVETQSETKKDPFQLAARVAERVEILNVLLAACDAKRSSTLAFKVQDVTLTTGLSNVGFGRNTEAKRLFISPIFNATLANDADEKTEVPLSITATFVLVYSVNSFDGIDDEHIRAFSVTNGVFNAWPYWREFVQNTTARMGLPRPITAPVFRLGANPFEGFPSSLDSSETLGQTG